MSDDEDLEDGPVLRGAPEHVQEAVRAFTREYGLFNCYTGFKIQNIHLSNALNHTAPHLAHYFPFLDYATEPQRVAFDKLYITLCAPHQGDIRQIQPDIYRDDTRVFLVNAHQHYSVSWLRQPVETVMRKYNALREMLLQTDANSDPHHEIARLIESTMNDNDGAAIITERAGDNFQGAKPLLLAGAALAYGCEVAEITHRNHFPGLDVFYIPNGHILAFDDPPRRLRHQFYRITGQHIRDTSARLPAFLDLLARNHQQTDPFEDPGMVWRFARFLIGLKRNFPAQPVDARFFLPEFHDTHDSLHRGQRMQLSDRAPQTMESLLLQATIFLLDDDTVQPVPNAPLRFTRGALDIQYTIVGQHSLDIRIRTMPANAAQLAQDEVAAHSRQATPEPMTTLFRLATLLLNDANPNI